MQPSLEYDLSITTPSSLIMRTQSHVHSRTKLFYLHLFCNLFEVVTETVGINKTENTFKIIINLY